MIGSIRFCLVGALLALGAGFNPAAANTINYQWLGVIQDFDVSPYQAPGVALGKTITIDLTVDDRTPDSDPSPEIGQYNYLAYDPSNPPPIVVDVTVGGLHDPHHYYGLWQQATILNDHNGIDGFTISTFEAHGIGTTFELDFSTSNLATLSSDGFPLSLNPHNFDIATFAFMGSDPISHPGYRGTLLAQTPLPPSAGLFGFALAGLVGTGWWKVRRVKTNAP